MQQYYKRWQFITKWELNYQITQLNKVKSAAKNKSGTTLRLTKKNFEDERLPHELIFTMQQKTKIRNAFANNTSTDIKLREIEISKTTRSSGSFGSWLGNLEKTALTNFAIPSAKDNLLGLSNLFSKKIYKYEIKTSREGAAKEEKGFTFFRMKIRMIILKS